MGLDLLTLEEALGYARAQVAAEVAARSAADATVAANAASALATHEADTTAVHGIADTAVLVLTSDSRLSDSRAPSGAAGGVLGGTYPNPTFAVDMATQAELDAQLATIDARRKVVKRSTINARGGNVTGSGTYLHAEGGTAQTPSSSGANWTILEVLSADLALAGRAMKMRLKAGCLVNATAPGITLTVGLYPVGTPVGGVNVFDPAIGTVVTGSTVAFTTPAASSKAAEVSSGTFDMPADGYYVVGVVASGAMATNSVVMIPYCLEIWGQ